jgi:hypothetical protein
LQSEQVDIGVKSSICRFLGMLGGRRGLSAIATRGTGGRINHTHRAAQADRELDIESVCNPAHSALNNNCLNAGMFPEKIG